MGSHKYRYINELVRGYNARVLKRKAREEKRIRYDRFRVIMVVFLLALIVLSCVVVGYNNFELTSIEKLSNLAPVTYRIGLILAAMLEESTASILYSSSKMNMDQADREVEKFIKLYQIETLKAIRAAAEDSDGCDICPTILSHFDSSRLLDTQQKVLRRGFTPMECFLEYRTLLHGIFRTMNYFMSETISDGAVSILWNKRLIQTVASLSEAVIGISGGPRPPDRVASIYDSVTTAIRKFDVIKLQSAMLEEQEPTWQSEFELALDPTYDSSLAVLSAIDVDLTGVSIAISTMTGEDAMNELQQQYVRLLKDVAETKPWKLKNIEGKKATAVCSIFIVIMAAATIVVTLYAALRVLWFKSEDFVRRENDEMMQRSIERMEFFVDRLADLDVEGVKHAARLTQRDISRTPIERQLVDFSIRFAPVLGFLSKDILSFRSKNVTLEFSDHYNVSWDNGENADENSAESQQLNPLGTAPPLQAFEDGYMMLDTSLSSTGTATTATALSGQNRNAPVTVGDPSAGDPFLNDKMFHLKPKSETLIFTRYVCFVLLDISCFYEEVSSSSAKGLTQNIPSCFSRIVSYVKENGGHYITTAGSTAVIGFFEGEIPDVEHACMTLLLSISAHVLNRYPKVRCGIVGRRVPQGLVGTDDLQLFITDGDVLHIGDLLFRVARLHDASYVVDSTTFVKLDTQYFDKLALEQVGLDDTTIGNVITVYQLVPIGKESSAQLWNEAFDAFLAEKYSEAEMMLNTWFDRHGSTKSLMRFRSMIESERRVTYLYASSDQFDAEFVLF